MEQTEKPLRQYSFYYRDSFSIISEFSDATNIELVVADENIHINGGVISLREPELLNPEHIHSLVKVDTPSESFIIQIDIRCWKEDGPYLKEATRLPWFQRTRFCHKLRNGIKKIFKTGYNSILLTQDGVTYSMKWGKLCWRSKKNNGVLSSQICLNRPEYNQMLKIGNIGIIRTENKIYASTDNLRSWRVINEGTRALFKSLIYDKESNSLIFSNYTGGDARVRHYLRRYNFDSQTTDTLLTFYTKKEHDEQGLSPFARHIHVIDVDPYTGDWYIGVGDYDGEPAIYRTCDKGQSFQMIGSGEQMWRTLSFIFRKDYIFWGADSESPQYLSRISRSQLNKFPIKDEDVVRFPLFNSALWFTYEDDGLIIMHSNSEGSFYDDCHRVYGIDIDEKGIPTVYSLFKEKSDPEKNNYIFNQLFFLAIDIDGYLWFYDNQNNINRKFKLVRDKNE